MGFILKGFTQEMGIRVFAFERVGEDHTRTEYTISADLALTRRYDIRVQDLPLLCRLFWSATRRRTTPAVSSSQKGK